MFWVWLVPAIILFCILELLVLWAALANAQSGEPFWGLIAFVCGTVAVALLAASWPITFPIALYLDLTEEKRKARG